MYISGYLHLPNEKSRSKACYFTETLRQNNLIVLPYCPLVSSGKQCNLWISRLQANIMLCIKYIYFLFHVFVILQSTGYDHLIMRFCLFCRWQLTPPEKASKAAKHVEDCAKIYTSVPPMRIINFLKTLLWTMHGCNVWLYIVYFVKLF